MHPDLAARAADLYRAEREREAREARTAREARAEHGRDGVPERREPRRGSARKRRRTRADGPAEQDVHTGKRARIRFRGA
ncbi:hypothetical protein [Nocardiopsis kunsanensis]|uniref:Uncharacterized protein n=1 Tax=Nocardiopsis kunsanensis TaxID=141693 RepID=A0A918X9W9_9ACTN|nr:hypothetical protein [Nocardiopsis kunsanensis]GHD18385.1 hypothetical protein GCM10007147_08530 [Nocardiopsis kunsanensis]